MALGSFTYQLSRATLLQASSCLVDGLGRNLFRGFSPFLALCAEVSVFESSHRVFSSGRNSSQENTFSESWRVGIANFGLLKSAGYLLGAHNIFWRHLGQDLATVAGHRVTSSLGWTPEIEGDFLQQMIQSEAMNLSLEAGMLMCHGFLGGQLSRIERGLEFRSHLQAPSHTQQVPLPSMANAEPIIPRPILRLLEDLRGESEEFAMQALQDLEGILLRAELSPPVYREVFYELFSALHEPHPKVEMQWLGLPRSLMERINLKVRGPRLLFVDMEGKDIPARVADARMGVYNGLLRNPSLGASDRECVTRWVGEVWEIKDAEGIEEAHTSCFQCCIDALETSHVEEWISEELVEGALSFAEREPLSFSRLIDENVFVRGILTTDFVTGYNQKRLVNLLTRIILDEQIDLYAGQRFYWLETLEKLAQDAKVPQCIRHHIHSQVQRIEAQLPDLLEGEFLSEKDVINHSRLIIRFASRPRLEENARIRLLGILYAAVKPYGKGYIESVAFAVQSQSNGRFSGLSRTALALLVLKSELDFQFFPPERNRRLDALHVEALKVLRDRVRESLRQMSVRDRADLMDFLFSLEIEGFTLPIEGLLGRNTAYMRNTGEYRQILRKYLRGSLSDETRRRVQLVLTLLDYN